MDDKIYATAIRMLAGREHSGFELRNKLNKKGYAVKDIESLIALLVKDKYLDDARFTESFVHSKINRGSGPIKIRLELQQRDIDGTLIDKYLDFNQPEWLERVIAVRCKRFGKCLPNETNEKAKQIRFLQQRGFTQKQIMTVLKCSVIED
ncbi:regulatory protein RecX [Beggiatoa alba]|nr:regulatory protein RecX [Beggiatoa alba]